MKITKDKLKQLIKQQLSEQYKIAGAPDQEGEPDPTDPENQWFKDPGIPVGAGGGPYKSDGGMTPGMPNPARDGIYPVMIDGEAVYPGEVYNMPKYQEYFDWLDREKKRFKKGGFPGQLHRAGPDIRKDPQYVPGYLRSRPPMAESTDYQETNVFDGPITESKDYKRLASKWLNEDVLPQLGARPQSQFEEFVVIFEKMYICDKGIHEPPPVIEKFAVGFDLKLALDTACGLRGRAVEGLEGQDDQLPWQCILCSYKISNKC